MFSAIHGLSLVSRRQDALQEDRSLSDLRQVKKRLSDLPSRPSVRSPGAGEDNVVCKNPPSAVVCLRQALFLCTFCVVFEASCVVWTFAFLPNLER